MNVIVYDNKGNTIRARLYTYDHAGAQLGDEIIAAGGADITKLSGAVLWKFVADGYKDAVIDDMYDYGSIQMEMQPAFPWVIPAFLGAAAVYVLSRYVKFN